MEKLNLKPKRSQMKTAGSLTPVSQTQANVVYGHRYRMTQNKELQKQPLSLSLSHSLLYLEKFKLSGSELLQEFKERLHN